MISSKIIKGNKFIFYKIFTTATIGTLIVASGIYPVSASEGISIAEDREEINLSNMNNYIEYSNDELIHFNTGETLYEKTVDGQLAFTVTDSQGNDIYQTKKIDNDTVEVTNLITGEKKLETLDQKEIKYENLPEDIRGNQEFTSMDSVEIQNDYVYERTIQSDANIAASTIGLSAAILAAFISIPVSLVTAAATHYFNTNIPHAYWYEVYSSRSEPSGGSVVRVQYIFHETHLYQNYIDTATVFYPRAH